MDSIRLNWNHPCKELIWDEPPFKRNYENFRIIEMHKFEREKYSKDIHLHYFYKEFNLE
jgi:hypothetical protein